MRSTITRLSCCAPKLVPIDRTGRHLGIASGAFYVRDSKVYLVSNWHVFSGRNAENGQCLDPMGAIPCHLEIHYRFLPDGVSALPEIGRIQIADTDNGIPYWRSHPEAGAAIDVAAIELKGENFAATYPANQDIVIQPPIYGVGDPVFILGYPKGFSGGHHYPVWKRGTIASELSQDIGDKPRFLVDATTTQGMSGSPVFFRETAYMVAAPHRTDGQHEYAVGNTTQIFLGIYSGRVAALAKDQNLDPMAAQLGYVWRRAVIDEILSQ